MSKEVRPKKVDEVVEIPSFGEGVKKVLDTFAKINSDTNKTHTDQPSQFEVVKTETKPVTLAGKTVAISASGKARLINTKTNRIITGFVDFKVALEQTKLYPHIQIVNENEQNSKG